MARKEPKTGERVVRRPTRARQPRRKKAEAGSRGLSPAEVAEGLPEAQALADAVRDDGGVALAVFREPLAGRAVILAALPLTQVDPTPYQRDLSESHVKRLESAIERVGRYLDPIVAVPHEGRYWTPNGGHRLAAMRALGAKTIVALVLPEEEVAYQILALNTEKAHNLKERSLEVIRMYRGLVGATEARESDLAHLLEEPAFVTLGAAYEKRPRFAAGAYNPILRRVESFLEVPRQEALPLREARAERLLELDAAVGEIVTGLKDRGLESPYLRNFVVARLNPLRFGREVEDADAAIEKMKAAARKFDASKVRKDALARMGGAPAEEPEG